jgi:hypothetical protein
MGITLQRGFSFGWDYNGGVSVEVLDVHLDLVIEGGEPVTQCSIVRGLWQRC